MIGCTLTLIGGGVSGLTVGCGSDARSRIGCTLTFTGRGVSGLTAG
jgi:hypothetical protein